MKKRILFAGLLLLLTLSTFAATPVTSGKTKDSRSHPQPENRLCSSSVSPGRLERLPGKLDPRH